MVNSTWETNLKFNYSWRPTRSAFAFALSVALSSPSVAASTNMTGNAMMKDCQFADEIFSARGPMDRSDGDWFGAGVCVGIIYEMVAVASSLPNSKICFPHGVSNDQIIKVILRFLRAHPERLHEDFRILSMVAALQAWPCAASK